MSFKICLGENKMLSVKTTSMIALLLLLSAAAGLSAETPPTAAEAELPVVFEKTVLPFLQSHCLQCHGKDKQEGKLNLSAYTSVAKVASDLRPWEGVIRRLAAHEMPPEDAQPQPTPEERKAVIGWVKTLRNQEARRNAGDPGPVLARRLSNAEYDNTIRDLTGVDLKPTREFPIDPANEAGFDNSGESLTMSPALLDKYLAAGRFVADHLLLLPDGIEFAPHPVITDTDRDKHSVRKIIEFYQKQRTDYADYFFAAWHYRHRVALGKPNVTLADVAAEQGVSPKYLTSVWSVLTDTKHDLGPVAELRKAWLALPEPLQDNAGLRKLCEQLRDLVLTERTRLAVPIGDFKVSGVNIGSQPIILWKNDAIAANRRRGQLPEGDERQETPEFVAAVDYFCTTFPDVLLVSERGRMYLDPKEQDKGRLLSAGFHLMLGYYRDDAPLYDLLLDENQQKQLDALWLQLDFATFAPERQFQDFVYFERAESPRFLTSAEFDFARGEDKDIHSQAKMQKLAEAYLAKARDGGMKEEAVEVIDRYFQTMSAKIRKLEKARLAAEPSQLEAVVKFTQRAYRRPLAENERDELRAFYRSLRETEELSHEDALRDTLVSVLMSPYFCYRVDPPGAGTKIGPLSDYALASRLSYFLWSSMPDEELLAHAAAGDLHQADVLASQTRRMLRDGRITGLATDFGGNWLDFRRFEQHNGVDRGRFPAFDDDLRQAMFEEPIRFFADLAQRDGSVRDFLNADCTLVNPVLAKHYGMELPSPQPNQWVRIDGARKYGRGGLLPMSVFLTSNSPGLRTSPVKRGYWVVRRLLGEYIPPPPPGVPELPQDEAAQGELTQR